MKKGIILFIIIICILFVSCESAVSSSESSELSEPEIIKKGKVLIDTIDGFHHVGKQSIDYVGANESISVDFLGETVDLRFYGAYHHPQNKKEYLNYRNDVLSLTFDPKTRKMTGYALYNGYIPTDFKKLVANSKDFDDEQWKCFMQTIITDIFGYDDIDLNEYELEDDTRYIYIKTVNGVGVRAVRTQFLDGIPWILQIYDYPGSDEYVPVPDWDDEEYIAGAKERLLENHKDDGELVEFEGSVSRKRLAYIEELNSYAVSFAFKYKMNFQNGTTDSNYITFYYLFSFE